MDHLAARFFLLLTAYVLVPITVAAQKASAPEASDKNTVGTVTPFNSAFYFIAQAGQYNTDQQIEVPGKIHAGYEGFSMPVLFTQRGLVFLQKKETKISHDEEEKLEKQGWAEEEIERKRNVVVKRVAMEWVNANPSAEIVFLDKTTDYHTYGKMPGKAFGYGKILYKNIYDGIDIVYTISQTAVRGFEYSFVIHPGADPSVIKMKYAGDVSKIKINADGNLIIKTGIDEIIQSGLTAFETAGESHLVAPSSASMIETVFKIDNNTVSFALKGTYDHSKTLVIDPFVSSAAALTGINAGKAKDVDFDYAGNIYVSGGGDGNSHQLAKYDASGVLQWTFNGTVNNPQWTFGPYYGGWVVEKTTGNIYLGQGFDFTTGFIVVRLSTTGLYDNYITTGNPNFRENWKMIWNCNNGLPQIIVAGGGTNSNINLGILSPPSVIPSAANITGIPDIAFQDMSDMVIDPLTNSMYTIYASGSVAALNNSIYKHNQPYSAATKVWNTASGYSVLQEAFNRPYLGSGLNDNSTNILAVNPNYLFYWDGRNLKAVNKTTGALAGTPLTLPNTALMQGGIIADACNNIFIGNVNGTIKVFTFNGSVFDDAAAPDITIPGFGTKSIYDLAYNETLKLLYISGDGFVASVDVAGYCPNTVYTLNVTPNCVTASATAVISPSPPVGSTVNYSLFAGGVQLISNTSGIFNSLVPATNYKIVATINQACSGTQSTTSFLMPGPTVGITKTDAACAVSSGTISATGSGTSAPYTYSINGTDFFASGAFNALAAGVYSVTVKDGAGCITVAQTTILNSNGPALSYTKTNADCGSSNASVTTSASGGNPPYQYSIDAGATWHSSNLFVALLAGQYTLMTKDGTGCTNAAIVTITSSPSPAVIAIPSAATCGINNGLINAFGNGGTAPYEYSVNGNTYQAANTFANLTPGSYTVTVKDANGCTQSTTVSIGDTPAPTVTATATQSACANMNGSITATGSGGLAPLQYSINNGPFQSGNVFGGLLGGTYSVTVQDIAGCRGSTSVSVTSISTGPVVTASATPSACNVNNGSIIAFASGGISPYQYSLNNINYQAGGTFNALSAGNYVIFAKDNAGCLNTFSIAVPPASGPVLTVLVTPSSCTVNDGAITAAAGGGLAPLAYSIDGVNFVPSPNFTGLAPNIYTVTVKDANGCSATRTVTVANASGLTLATAALASSCSGNSGLITATANGGVAPLQFSLDGVNYQASTIFSALAPGTYTVYVKDANACIVTKTSVVSSVSAPSLTVNSINATCGSASGAIRAAGFGGIAPLTYNIDGGAFSATNAFVNLASGVHTIIVKDAGGCTASQSVTITNSGSGEVPTNVTFTVRNALPCTGGVVKIKNLRGLPSGGGRSYEFSLDFGSFTGSNQFIGVAPGNHIITALNEDGCTVSRIAAIGSGTPATASYTAVGTACGTSNGSITIAGVGGSVPYHASIDNGVTWVTFFPPGANTFTFSNLAPGTYPIIMADDADYTVGTPDIPGACLSSILATVPTIGGPVVSVVKFDGTCLLNDGTITATGIGVAPFTFSINGGPYQASGSFTNLASGIYTIDMIDGNSCTTSTTVTISNPTGPVVTATAVTSSCNSNNGSIIASSTNGVGTVQYSLDGFSFQPGVSFTNLAAGNYTLYAKDANGCYNSTIVTVAATPLPRVTAFSIAASCGNADGSILVTASGGTAPYQISLDGTVFQSSTTFSGLPAGFYTVTIRDARGCTNTTAITLGNSGAPVFTNTAATATCGNANGVTTITATGGLAPYAYSSDAVNFQANNIITGLPAGNSVITVRDANGCIAPKIILVGSAAGVQSLTASVVNASCGASNGSITATATGGVGALQYSRDGVVFQAGNLFAGVVAGNYTLYVRDASLCVKTLPVSVTNLTGPLVNTVLPAAATCSAGDGAIVISASGGTGLLTFSINGSAFQPANIFSNLVSGSYNITVKDIRGCTNTLNNIVVPSVSGLSILASPVNPTCGNSDGTLTIAATSGNEPYQYSIDGINFQPGNQFNALAAGTYSVTVNDASGCSANSSVTMVSPSSNPKRWLGLSTDWQDAANWCGGVPLLTENVLIPSGLVNYPALATGTGYAKNITIEAGASVVVTSALQVADSISNAGTFNAVQGTVELKGISRQEIAGSMFYQHTIHELIISNTSTAGVVGASTPGDSLKISRRLGFGFDDAVLTTGDNITLLSSDTATANIGVIKEKSDGSPRVSIIGKITVERYYPRKRAWRLITAPFKNDGSAPSINTAWQEGVNPPAVTGVSNPDPHPGYGTHITGPFPAATAYSPMVTGSGFDQSPQNNSSMKYYDGLTNSYQPVTNTFTTKVNDRQGYLVFVRGDRSYDISTTSNTMSPAATILRVHGNVNAGVIRVPADTGLQVIGNPYPSAIRFGDSMFVHNAAILKNQSFWLWDPLRGSARNSPSNVGGWIPVVYAGAGVYTSTYDPSQSVAGLDSAHAFDINGTIQSGAAFMIDNKATAAGDFVIHENSKTEGSNNQLFRPAAGRIPRLSTSLFRVDAENKPVYWADGTMIILDETYRDEPSWDEDVRKVFSSGENLSIRHREHQIAIEKRKNILPGDTIWYNVNKLKAGKYRFELFFNEVSNLDAAPFFEDAYTGLQTAVSFTQHTLVDVEINADTASFAASRFRLVFKPLQVLPLKIVSFTAWEEAVKIPLQWIVSNQLSVAKYVVEESADGRNFSEMATVPATNSGNNNITYNAADMNVHPGNNFYRLRMINIDGSFVYSETLLVEIVPGISFMQVSPNPVRGNNIRLLMQQVSKGKYRYNLFNTAGQLVHKGNLVHGGGSNVYSLQPVQKLLPGIYKLELISTTHKRVVLGVSVNE